MKGAVEHDNQMLLSKELQLGKAAEHLVVADLQLAGYQAFLADAGSAFDIVVVVDGKLRTIQVRSTQRRRQTRRSKSQVYRFGLRRGKHGHQCSGEGINFFAFVALDTKEIAYFHANTLRIQGKLIQILELHRTPSVRQYKSGTRYTYKNVRVMANFYPFNPAVG